MSFLLLRGYIYPFLCIYFINKPFLKFTLVQKRFYIRGTIPFIKIHIGWKSLALIMIGWDPWITKKVKYLSCIDQWKTFDVFYNSARQLFLYYKISFSNALRERLVEEREGGRVKFVEMFFGFSFWLPSRKNCFGSLNCPTCRITSYTLRSWKSGFTFKLSNLIVHFLVGKKGSQFLNFTFVRLYLNLYTLQNCQTLKIIHIWI